MTQKWHVVDIKDPALYSEARDLARTGGEDNMGYNCMSGWIAVKDYVLAVQLMLAYG